MIFFRHLVLSIVCIGLSACGTFLSVSEISPNNKTPDGIAINKRATYKVTVNSNEIGIKLNSSKKPIVGIDENKMLLVNATRMPFASGTLKIELSKNQLTTTTGLSSFRPKTANYLL